MSKKRLREHEASDATNIRHKNSPIFRQHFGRFAYRQSHILKLKHFDARIFGSLRLMRIHALTFSRF